jgi:hypothetical protein
LATKNLLGRNDYRCGHGSSGSDTFFPKRQLQRLHQQQAGEREHGILNETTSGPKNTMKTKLIVLAMAAAALSGCSTTNITKLTQALAKDPAIVVLNVGSVYGTVRFTRVGSITNGMTISPDGTVTVR